MNFEDKFKKLLKYFHDHSMVEDVSKHFGSENDMDNMFEYLWNLEKTHDYMNVNVSKLTKCNRKSESFRKEGNKYYQLNKMNEALEYYNKSIMFAYINRENSQENSSPLSLGYANYSAVLFELKFYAECKCSIEKSIYYGYPTLLKPKLIERLAKCCIVLKKRTEAIEILENYLLECNNLEEKEMTLLEVYRQKLFNLLSECNDDAIYSDDDDTDIINDYITIQNIYLKDTHSSIPSLSNAVDISYSEDKGRYLTSTRDILPGEIIISENGFGVTALSSVMATHCSFCLERVLTPVPCSKCPSVLFCSKECLIEGGEKFHDMECPFVSTLYDLDVGINANLALRIIVQLPVAQLKENLRKFKHEKFANKRKIGFNEQNRYSSDDYRTIYHLVTNKESRSIADMFKRVAISLILVKLLLKSNFFGTNVDPNCPSTKSEIMMVGKTLLIHMMNLPCNAHSINELQVSSKCFEDCHMKEIGAGAYSVLSLLNHSCDPTIARSSYGTTTVARAIQFIHKGQEITDSYGHHFAIHLAQQRQNDLLNQYYFKCSCNACTNNWAVYNELSNTMHLKCPYCKYIVDLDSHKCTDEKAESLLSELRFQIKKFDEAYTSIIDGNVTAENERTVTDIISLLGKYAEAPSQILFKAQECFKFCCDRKGNHWKYV